MSRKIILLTNSENDWDELKKILSSKGNEVAGIEYMFINCDAGCISSDNTKCPEWDIALVHWSKDAGEDTENISKIMDQIGQDLIIGIHSQTEIDYRKVLNVQGLPFQPKRISTYNTLREEFSEPIEELINSLSNQTSSKRSFDRLWSAFNPETPWRLEYFLEISLGLLALPEENKIEEEFKKVIDKYEEAPEDLKNEVREIINLEKLKRFAGKTILDEDYATEYKEIYEGLKKLAKDEIESLQ